MVRQVNPCLYPRRKLTASGNQFEFEFLLHGETGSAVHVSSLLDALLGTVDRELPDEPREVH